MEKLGRIEAVLKITERCNINCTYCYIFNKDSDLFARKPKQMSLETARAVAKFLRQGALDTGAGSVRIIFHGGEPMMMRPATFDEMCSVFVSEIHGDVPIDFAMQTNATLVNEHWISIFEKYQIGIGVSLDGPRNVNDLTRVDHRGRGTYDRTASGVQRLFAAHRQGRISAPAVLCVIDPAQDGAATFRHLAVEMGFKWIDFLLPIDTRDTMAAGAAQGVGTYLRRAFEAWNELNDKSIAIRFFDQFYAFMTGHDRLARQNLGPSGRTLILTVASDGTYGPDDALRIVSDELFNFDCRHTSIPEYLHTSRIRELTRANLHPAEECRDCAWAAYCVGGSTNGRVVNRYSRSHGFRRKSVLCEGLVGIYGVLARSLIDAGYSPHAMYERLDRAAEQILEPVDEFNSMAS